MEIVEINNQIAIFNDDDVELGILKFVESSETITVQSTRVEEYARGQGIAEKLVSYIVDKAEKNNKTIVPSCSYAQYYLEKHPELSSIFK